MRACVSVHMFICEPAKRGSDPYAYLVHSKICCCILLYQYFLYPFHNLPQVSGTDHFSLGINVQMHSAIILNHLL